LKLINRGLSGTVQVIGDKSISHRAILFSALAEGTSVIKNLLISEDTKASLEIVEQMGADVKIQDKVSITGQGINGLKNQKMSLMPRILEQLLDCLLDYYLNKNFRQH